MGRGAPVESFPWGCEQAPGRLHHPHMCELCNQVGLITRGPWPLLLLSSAGPCFAADLSGCGSMAAAGLGWTALVAAGLLLLWLLAKLPGLVSATFGGRAQGGRWVRDRSLGGKLVRDEPHGPSMTIC